MSLRLVDGVMTRLTPAEETALQTGHVSVKDLYKDLLADRERLLEEIAKRDAKIQEYERGLGLAADMIMCISQLKGIE